MHVYSVTMGDDTGNAAVQLSLQDLCAKTKGSIQKKQVRFREIRTQLELLTAQIIREQKVYSNLDKALKASQEALELPIRREQSASTPTMCKKHGCCNKAEPRNYGYCLTHRQLGQNRRGQPSSSTVNHRGGSLPSVGNKRPSQSHSGLEAHSSKVARTNASQATSATPHTA